MATYDSEGVLLTNQRMNGRARRPQQLGWLLDGGALWEWLHPGTVQQEYEAVGATLDAEGNVINIPTVEDIRSDATQKMIDRARNDTTAAFSSGMDIGRLVVVGLVAYAVIKVAGVIPAPRGRSLRQHYVKRARRAIAKRIAG